MSELASRERLQPSLLDRLTDDAPDHKRESLDQQSLSMQQLRRAVLRDLAWLLNTTNLVATDDLDGAPLAAKSTINFGIPSFAGLIGTARKVGSLESGIADAIRAFEPRIRADSLKVRLRPAQSDQPSAALTFEIQGELWAQPVPQQLFLETMIELETRMAVVTDAKVRG
ncbi:MAG TPA: type VI secretion system baseplate subunit TssE [Acetobacteraceae bacterium]|nr:type VI secretion system baseplate subunit TssE [Acetobacteraceae bacterium]